MESAADGSEGSPGRAGAIAAARRSALGRLRRAALYPDPAAADLAALASEDPLLGAIAEDVSHRASVFLFPIPNTRSQERRLNNEV